MRPGAPIARLTTTVSLAGRWEEETPGGAVVYLHGDHLGSVSVATSAAGALLSKQDFTPWGEVRAGDIPQTTLDFTGQRRDATGLLYYHARPYDPALG
jgi:hypothetical protein